MFTPPNGTLTILSGQTASGEFDLGQSRGRELLSLLFLNPAALTGVVTIQISDVTGGTFRTLQTGGADITLGAAKAVVVTELPSWGFLRLSSTLAEGANRVFNVYGVNRD